jgi:hypothetical protein
MTALTCALTLLLAADPTEPKLRQELLDRVAKDQKARFALIESNPLGGKGEVDAKKRAETIDAVAKIDADNRVWLKGVIDQDGWPGIARVGKDGAHAAWLMVQHADADRPFQKKCLGLLERAVAAKDAAAVDLAYLTDRVLVGEGKKQKYGTQLSTKDGKLTPSPVEDEDKLDERRKALGLQPMAEYIKDAESLYKGAKPKSADKK